MLAVVTCCAVHVHSIPRREGNNAWYHVFHYENISVHMLVQGESHVAEIFLSLMALRSSSRVDEAYAWASSSAEGLYQY